MELNIIAPIEAVSGGIRPLSEKDPACLDLSSVNSGPLSQDGSVAAGLVLYLTLDVDEDSNDGDDILYQFPRENVPEVMRKVWSARGSCITVCVVMGRIATGTISTTAVAVGGAEVCVGGAEVCVGGLQAHREVLLVALPAAAQSLQQTRAALQRVETGLVFLFGSLQRAFSPINIEKNMKDLDYMFSGVLSGCVCGGGLTGLEDLRASVAEPSPAVDKSLKDRIAAEMQRFESLDFCEPGLEILGTALHCQESLLYSGLPGSCTFQVTNCLKLSSLLRPDALVEGIGGTVVWREVYVSAMSSHDEKHPTNVSSKQQQQQQQKEKEKQQQEYSQYCHNHDCGGSVSQPRTYLLAIRVRDLVLSVLLQRVCQKELNQLTAPNPLLVDMGKTLLLRLNAEGMLKHCTAKASQAERLGDSMVLQACIGGDWCTFAWRPPSKSEKAPDSESTASLVGLMMKSFPKAACAVREEFADSAEQPNEYGLMFEASVGASNRKGKEAGVQKKFWIIGRACGSAGQVRFVSVEDALLDSRTVDSLFASL